VDFLQEDNGKVNTAKVQCPTAPSARPPHDYCQCPYYTRVDTGVTGIAQVTHSDMCQWTTVSNNRNQIT